LFFDAPPTDISGGPFIAFSHTSFLPIGWQHFNSRTIAAAGHDARFAADCRLISKRPL